MEWKQVRSVDPAKMGKIKGSCLYNTRIAAVPLIPKKYDPALEAMLNTQLHAGAAPRGVWVPLFFDFWATIEGVYANWGHVGWSAPDGSFWSDGVKYSSLAAYTKNHAPKYRGWGESLNGVRVVELISAPASSKPSGRTLLHLNKGTITTTYDKNGSIYARDDTYDYTVHKDEGYRVQVNSKSVGGLCWIYLIYQTGANKGRVIPGRTIK